MAGYKSSRGRRSTRIKLLIYENLVQEPDGLTTIQLFERLQRSSIGRYVASPASLAQTIRITRGVEQYKTWTSNADGQSSYMCAVWVMADPNAFIEWYGDDI